MNKNKNITFLTNVRILNPYGDIKFIPNGALMIKDGIIIAIGESDSIGPSDNVIDLKGKTVLPGMINAHGHLYSSLAMGMPSPERNPTNFTEILQQVWWILDRALDKNSTKASFEAGLLDHLRHGVTTVIDHHSSQHFVKGSLDLLAETANTFGINISTAFEMTDRNGTEIFRKGLDENIRFHRKYHQSQLVRPLIGLHASFTLSDESLQIIARQMKSLDNWGIHIHVGEDKADQVDAERRGYSSVIQRLDSFGLLNENSLVIHGTHLQPGDETIMNRSGASLVHNPSSNANNRVGMTPAELIHGLKAGLGTDGMQGNMLAEAKEGTLIRSSHQPGGASSVNYAELLFKNNPEIVTRLFGRKIGKLDPGYRADMAIYDYHPRTKFHEGNWISHVLFGLNKPSDVMAGGQFKIRDGRFVNIPDKDILENAVAQSSRLWKKMKTINKLERQRNNKN